ncbi:ABC transporter permease [Candidatus Mcinerneyibacteriota bacterium]|nr:ABC transporter permease [Candidatus Mcinerneyibacteriota bacterium]
MGRIRAVVKKEMKHIVRDRRSFSLLVIIPLFMLVLFGFALNFNVTEVPMDVIDRSQSAESRLLIDKFVQSGYFKVRRFLPDEKEALDAMSRGKSVLILDIPGDFSHNLRKGIESDVGLFFDGVDTNTATAAMSYAENIISLFNRERAGTAPDSAGIDFRPRVWYNPELSSRVFLIPGLIVYILMIITVVSTSLTIVREREERTIEQLIVSPLGSMELILGKVVPYMILTLGSALAIMAFGYLIFGVGVKGSLLLLFLSMAIFLTVGVATGILISAIADTRQFAFLLSVLFTVLPTLLLSGFVFPIRNMAPFIQGITYLVPARYFTEIIRNIYIKGVGFETFWGEFSVMTLMAAGLLFISIRKLRSRLS